jgi:hypothetical protein
LQNLRPFHDNCTVQTFKAKSHIIGEKVATPLEASVAAKFNLSDKGLGRKKKRQGAKR